MYWKRLLSFFAPSPAALTFAWAALIVSLLLSLTITVISLSDAPPAGIAILYSVVALPPAVLLLLVAFFIERKPGARFLIWGLVAGLALVSITGLLSAGFVDAGVPQLSTISLITCCCLPFFASLGLFSVFIGMKAYPAFLQALRAARLQRIVAMVQARGESTISDIGAELSLDEAQSEKLLIGLIAAGELMAYYDLSHQRVYSAAALNEKQRRLLAMINIQGRATLQALADELSVSHELVRDWVYSLVRRGQLHGFADWSAGDIYSLDIAGNLAQKQCPHCGGSFDIVGKDLLQCKYCGVEMFL